jgi:hypothetical protein
MQIRISKKSVIGMWFYSFICLIIGQILVSLRLIGIKPESIVKQKQIIEDTGIPTVAYCIMAILIAFLILFFIPKTRAVGFDIFFALFAFIILALGYYGVIKAILAKDLHSYSNGITISSAVLLYCILTAVIGFIINYTRSRKTVKHCMPPPLPKTKA